MCEQLLKQSCTLKITKETTTKKHKRKFNLLFVIFALLKYQRQLKIKFSLSFHRLTFLIFTAQNEIEKEQDNTLRVREIDKYVKHDF